MFSSTHQRLSHAVDLLMAKPGMIASISIRLFVASFYFTSTSNHHPWLLPAPDYRNDDRWPEEQAHGHRSCWSDWCVYVGDPGIGHQSHAPYPRGITPGSPFSPIDLAFISLGVSGSLASVLYRQCGGEMRARMSPTKETERVYPPHQNVIGQVMAAVACSAVTQRSVLLIARNR